MMKCFFSRAVAGSFATAVLLFITAQIAVGESVKDLPRPTNYVSDFAGVLSPQTTAALDQLCSQVDHQAHAQIAVVIIKTLDDVPIEDFATQLEDKWGVGPKKNDRGILVILSTEDRKRRIEVGYGLEGVITDQQAGDIGRAMVPDLQASRYDNAVAIAVTQIASKIATSAGVTLQPPRRGPPQGKPMTLGHLLLVGGIFLVLLIVVARSGGSGLLGFLIGMFLGGGGGRGGGDGDGGDSGGGFGGFGGGSSGGGGASGSW